MLIQPEVQAGIDTYVDALQGLFDALVPYPLRYRRSPERVFTEYGRRFVRIAHDNGVQRMVHSFVDLETGDVIKAAGWKAPQKRADGTFATKYNLATPEGLAELIPAMDWSGRYLYLR